ncbi:lasso peptide biosynthesis B2 protein [Streptomyces triculaminicus]|uniref:lasso peptide biosynthesis B2 protein n=1 Tax=Streptomyces triculaminicus TaxID=2816232 RepID=UPI0037B87BDF
MTAKATATAQALDRPPLPGWRLRVPAYAAACLAAPLARRPPAAILRILRLVARGARGADYASVCAYRAAVVAVSPACRGQQGCLRRSLAVVLLARLYGQRPDWCVGVRTSPFAAHAWVEVDGRPAGEEAGGEVGTYRTLLSSRPAAGAEAGEG